MFADMSMVDFQPLFSRRCSNFEHLFGCSQQKADNWSVFDHPQRQRCMFFHHCFGLKRDFDSSLRLRWKVFYHFVGKGGIFSLTFLKNVVDFVPTILMRGDSP